MSRPKVVLTLSLETPRHKEDFDPFLVELSQLPSCGDHVATMTAPPSLSYEIEAGNLLRNCHSRL